MTRLRPPASRTLLRTGSRRSAAGFSAPVGSLDCASGRTMPVIPCRRQRSPGCLGRTGRSLGSAHAPASDGLVDQVLERSSALSRTPFPPGLHVNHSSSKETGRGFPVSAPSAWAGDGPRFDHINRSVWPRVSALIRASGRTSKATWRSLTTTPDNGHRPATRAIE